MKKILLVFPKYTGVKYFDVNLVPFLKTKATMMNLALPTVAAFTPKDRFKVEIVDMNVESLNIHKSYDIVGITGFPASEPSARWVADTFRAKGALIVCGGSATTLSPERWRPFADVLIRGEAERIWPQFLEDYLKGEYRKEYVETERFDLTGVTPMPDFRGLKGRALKRYQSGMLQTSRGCPYNCEFCDVIVYVGRRVRHKAISQILAEAEQLYRLGFRRTFICDDNFTGNRRRVKKILEALRQWNRSKKTPMLFSTQLSIDTARDEELLELAVEAGLSNALVGIESANVASLKEVGKIQNVQGDLLEDIKTMSQHGIMIFGTSIIGFDNDDLSAFERMRNFFMQSGIPFPATYALQAPDGTALKKRMMAEQRYRGWNPVVNKEAIKDMSVFSITPKQMTVLQLRQGLQWLEQELYKPERVAQRLQTFLEWFDQSPKRDRLKIPKAPFQWRGLMNFWRTLRYVRREASPNEREAFKSMMAAAKQSVHPQAVSFAILSYWMMKSVHEASKLMWPESMTVSYPSASGLSAGIGETPLPVTG